MEFVFSLSKHLRKTAQGVTLGPLGEKPSLHFDRQLLDGGVVIRGLAEGTVLAPTLRAGTLWGTEGRDRQ